MEAHLVGYDDESKGYRIFWKQRPKVTIERDVYFNKNDTLLPEIAHSEGENDKLEIKADHSEHISVDSKPIATTKTPTEGPDTQQSNEPTNVSNVSKAPENDLTQSAPFLPPPKSTSSPILTYPHENSTNSDSSNNGEEHSNRPKRSRPAAGFYSSKNQTKIGENAGMLAHMQEVEDDTSTEDFLTAQVLKSLVEDALAAGGYDAPTADEAL